MKIARTSGFATISLLSLACFGSGGPETPSNVLLILLDTARADHFGSYGYSTRPTSPHIDAFAATSIRFTRAYSQAPWTTPSVAALLSSRYPSALGLRDVPDALADDVTTLPEVLAQAGYATGAVVSHDFIGPTWNLDQGFVEFSTDMARGHGFVSSPGVTELALGFLERRRDEPFFLLVHYFDPHARYLEHETFPFASESPTVERVPITPRELRRIPRERLGDEQLAYLRARYDSELAYTDLHVGRLLEGLEEFGLAERTLVILTADHGEEFLDHEGFGHTNTLYDELIRVPLIVRLPGQSEGAVSDRVVGLVDVMPTVLQFLGLSVPEAAVGRSLLREDTGEGPRVVMSETARRSDLVAAISDRGKVIHDRSSGRSLFFDRARNPKEDPARAEGLQGASEPLRRALTTWLERPLSPPKEDAVELDPARRERLRAMGYLE